MISLSESCAFVPLPLASSLLYKDMTGDCIGRPGKGTAICRIIEWSIALGSRSTVLLEVLEQ